MAMKFVGSLCLSDIPKKQIKWVKCSDGVERAYVNISIHELNEPRYSKDGSKVVSDHLISCAPKKEEREDGVNYICGNLRTWTENNVVYAPSPEDINAAPSADEYENEQGVTHELPF